MKKVLDAVPPDHRALILDELKRRNPDLITDLAHAEQPSISQSDAIIDALALALSANYGPGHMPNDYGLAVERAIDAYLEVWPTKRRMIGYPAACDTRTMVELETMAQRILREGILAGGHDDWVSMAEVRGYISRGHLADSVSDRQQLMLWTIRSLLQDGLVEVGDIPGPSDPGFLVWPGTLDEVMAGLAERIVDQYDDPDSWEYSTWLNLTPKGNQASDDVVRQRSNRGTGHWSPGQGQ